MSARTARLGKFFFTLVGLYCLAGVLQTIDFAGGPGYSRQRAMINLYIWGGGTLVSIVALIICSIIYKRKRVIGSGLPVDKRE